MKLSGIVMFMLLFCLSAIAQDSPLPPEMADQDFVSLLFASLGGMGGMSALGIAALVTQLVAKFLNTQLMGKLWAKIPGIWKIVTVVLLTAAGGVLGMVHQGVSWGAALIHSSVISALMITANQIYKHVTEKK